MPLADYLSRLRDAALLPALALHLLALPAPAHALDDDLGDAEDASASSGGVAPVVSIGPAIAPTIAISGAVSSAVLPAPRPLTEPYPVTRRQDLVETKFGVPVADPYRWLENDVRGDGEVRNWVSGQNKVTGDYLATLPGRETLRARMAKLFDYARIGLPRKAGSRYFYTRNSGLQNQSPLYVRDGLEGEGRLLLDPNGFAKDSATALAEWVPSRDGRHLLYAVQDGGTDWRTLKVLDVETGKPLDDQIQWVRYSTLAWAKNGQGFFYSRFDLPPEGSRFQSTLENHRVYYHALGTPQSADRMLYETPDRPALMHRAQVTDDGRWLVISSTQGTDDRHEINIVPLEGLAQPDADLKPRRLVRGLGNLWTLAGSVGDKLYFRTDQGAERGRLVTLDASRPGRKPEELVHERPLTLVGASMIGSRIVLAYVSDGRMVAERIDLQGKPAGDIGLPGIGTASGFSGRGGDPETFFRFSSFTTPSTIYRFNVETGETSLFAQPALAFDPANFIIQQTTYASKDGTLVPLFIVRRKDIALEARAAPTLLYGYGGFNISMTPGFSPTQLAWVEQGGVLAIANVRGGGEFGKEWHDAGRLSNKQNVFDDFIAAGEYLISRGYTGEHQLAIEGRSNGGLLVGAVVNQRPDLFAAALPAVGVMDMLRFDQFTAGRYWVDDYGRPDKEPDFRNLLSYSPYHNIHEGKDYPAILVTTADTDDRVVPGHSFKYAAALQHAAIGDKPHLIRIETRAGHGSGKPVDKLIEEAADMYSFAAYWTGLKVEAK